MDIYGQNPSSAGYLQAIQQAMQAQGLGGGQQGPAMAPQGAQAGGLDPAMVQGVLGMQGQAPANAQIQRQLQMAQGLRAQGQAGMKQQTFGNGQVAAPNWAGALANVYAAKKAGEMEAGADKKTEALSGARQDALRRYFEALSSRGQQSAPMGGPQGGGGGGFGYGEM